MLEDFDSLVDSLVPGEHEIYTFFPNSRLLAEEADDANLRRFESLGLCCYERSDLLLALPRSAASLPSPGVLFVLHIWSLNSESVGSVSGPR